MLNKKMSSIKIAKIASATLRNKSNSIIQKKLSASILSQYGTDKVTGPEMEDIVSKVLSSSKYNKKTKSLAGSILSQSDQKR